MTAYKSLFLALIIIGFTACEPPVNFQEEAQQYLDTYNKKYQELYYASSKAEWKSNTEIIEGDSTNGIATRRANEAMATFTGGAANIEMAQKYLAQQDKPTALAAVGTFNRTWPTVASAEIHANLDRFAPRVPVFLPVGPSKHSVLGNALI